MQSLLCQVMQMLPKKCLMSSVLCICATVRQALGNVLRLPKACTKSHVRLKQVDSSLAFIGAALSVSTQGSMI